MKTPLVGISQIGVALPNHFISIEELAKKRKLEPSYALEGLRVFEARIPYGLSIEELGIRALEKIDYQNASRFCVGTESDFDASKPFSVRIITRGLGLPLIPFQYKFACLGGLQALISASDYCLAHPKESAIVLNLDRSLYRETEPAAEITQGAAAVALKIEINPKLLAIDYQNIGQYAVDIDDFKAPFSSFPFPEVNGELTKPAYLRCLKGALEDWKKQNPSFIKKIKKQKKTLIEAFDFFVIHTPFPKITEWAAALFWRHEKLREKEHISLVDCLRVPGLFREYKKEIDEIRKRPNFQNFFEKKVRPGLKYNSQIGNSYTCSVFISLVSVLEQAREKQTIGINGYGGGAGAICIKGTVTTKKSFKSELGKQLKEGKKLSIGEYEKWRKKQTTIC